MMLLSVAVLFAQNSEETPVFQKKGKILVETGYGIIGGYSTGTGISTRIGDETISALGLTIGKFVSENFAIKANFGILSGDGPSINNLSGAAKYYVSGRAPIELSAGYIDFDTGGTAIASLKGGYAAQLADNIYLEPMVGIALDESRGYVTFDINFALML